MVRTLPCIAAGRLSVNGRQQSTKLSNQQIGHFGRLAVINRGSGYEIWDIGEGGECALAYFIIGAYWHYSEYHSGQSSKGYYALSLLGMVFDPNMTEMDNDSPEFHAYQSLNELAAQYDPRPRLVP